ncbi:MAG: gfo/Idh/MocA family oxidoreductase [Lachnospiraceae bacterium]|nr:gfo/Idh/MocA family oxidoreductase [Lachnospiraceae bacterium]
MEQLKIGIVGLGCRGMDLLSTILKMNDVEVVAVCDEYQDRMQDAAKLIEKNRGNIPLTTKDYKELVNLNQIQAVVISCAWESHVEVACAAMEAGKYAGMEVGGAYSVEDCWELVRTSERTGVPCMLLENCCYTKRELMCLNMVKLGLFGEIVHCDGGYHHDIRYEIGYGKENRHYRLRNYLMRNCDNYPTHELGPIAKILNINEGNRMVSLVSIASKASGMNDYMLRREGAQHCLASEKFAQGDFITTIIRCAGGETITLTLDTTLPRIYSRGFTVRGTRGYYEETTDAVHLDIAMDFEGDIDWGKFDWAHCKDNAEEYAKDYSHPLWKKFASQKIEGGHDGGDWLVLRAFFESAAKKVDVPIDVYDAAAWMSITTLSEDSVAMGGLPVPIPDFTRGKWLKGRKRNQVEDYRLDQIPQI